MSREAARRAALMKFGGVAQAKEADREVRSFPILERLWADVRDAVRGFRRTPASTSVVVLTLALGIGVTTAIFSVVYGVLLKPLPFNEPDRLVAVNHRMPGFGVPRNGPQSAATYFTYRDHARVFEDIGVWNTTEVSVTTRDTPERIRVLRVSDGQHTDDFVRRGINGERLAEDIRRGAEDVVPYPVSQHHPVWCSGTSSFFE